MAPERGYVTVLEPPNSVAAELARGLLESEGIPVFVQSFQVPWYDGIMTPGAGAWGKVMVPARFAEPARALLEAYFRNQQPRQEPSPDEKA
ncbi:MAG: DUF2007 domain-containing protein [Armatimonadota bacterium]|nr:DUF2007 domain-containing protein [Armatimonadota bacterium]